MNRLLRCLAAWPAARCAGVLLCLLLQTGLAPLARADKGVNGNELYALSDEALAATIAGYRRLGVKWVRFDFDWSVIEPRPHGYQVKNVDRVVERLARADIRILGIIAYTPAWANGGKPNKFHPPADARAFAEFAAYLAARYSAKGVHAWEIWNEPNLGQFWGNAPDPAAYAALLKQVYPAIKKSDPGAWVVTGGLAQPATSATAIDSLGFLESMYRHGAQGYFDAVGNHPYTSPRMPGDWAAHNWRKMAASSPSFLSIMKRYGDGGKKIWITEYGAPTGGKDRWGTVISEARQADMVEQTFGEAASLPWAGPVFWYNYRDFCPYAPDADAECFFGLVRFDGSPKPAFEKFRAAR